MFKITNGEKVEMSEEETLEFQRMASLTQANDRNTREMEIREKRNELLRDSDWTVVADAPTNKKAWKEYRQLLRDVTKQPGFPQTVEWPIAPK